MSSRLLELGPSSVVVFADPALGIQVGSWQLCQELGEHGYERIEGVISLSVGFQQVPDGVVGFTICGTVPGPWWRTGRAVFTAQDELVTSGEVFGHPALPGGKGKEG